MSMTRDLFRFPQWRCAVSLLFLAGGAVLMALPGMPAVVSGSSDVLSAYMHFDLAFNFVPFSGYFLPYRW